MTIPHIQGRDALRRAYAVLPAEEASGHRWLMETYVTVIDALTQQLDGQVAGKSVIDVGAGRGIVALALRFLGMEVAACERYVFAQNPEGMFHSKNAEQILHIWQAHGIHPLIGDVTRLSEVCKERQFDAAVSIQVIEHLPGPKNMLDGIYTVLKPGGTLVLSALWQASGAPTAPVRKKSKDGFSRFLSARCRGFYRSLAGVPPRGNQANARMVRVHGGSFRNGVRSLVFLEEAPISIVGKGYIDSWNE